MGRAGQARRRVKISATVDPVLIRVVDNYVADHAGLDRSAVIDEALQLWCMRQQAMAMAAQYAVGEGFEPPADELAAWRAAQRATLERRVTGAVDR